MRPSLSRPARAVRGMCAITVAWSAGCGDPSPARTLADAPFVDDAAVSPDAAPDATVPDAPPACSPVDSHVHLDFDTVDAEWVKGVTWLDSQAVLTPNLARFGAGQSCAGPNEQFGQLYGAPEGTPPSLVGGNTQATLTRCGSDVKIVSAPFTCDAVPTAQIPVTTEYHFYGGVQASQVRITRTIGFGAATPVYAHTGIRPYVPRVPISMFTTVLVPDGASTATRSIGTCFSDCFTSVGADWNGRWFADVAPASGLAMIVLRDPSVTSPVDLTVNNDSSSGSNLSSFVVLQPAGGWKAPITEIEYLCFADLASWPQAQRDAATLPAGCGP